jgi:hypothetical protein
MAGELEEVVAFVEGEPQRPGDGSDRRRGGTRAAALLQSRVEVGRHVCERRDLLAAQPGCPPAAAGAQADVLGLQCLTAVAQEICLWLGSHSLPALRFCLGLDCSGPSIDCQSGLLVLRSITSLPSLDEDRRQRPCRPDPRPMRARLA